MLDNSGTERDESEGRMAFPKSFVKVIDALGFVGHCHVWKDRIWAIYRWGVASLLLSRMSVLVKVQTGQNTAILRSIYMRVFVSTLTKTLTGARPPI